ncbi:VOC family protein [Iodobacter sp. CM08]|uniref:VOC family protein n=1 Tax=Iodobacter sp. CM08 TaxID=3085902 RepID=UPI0029822BD8|nr:VOC family protein [Iodobacter sp. CM08]MDW5417969.1 VOC family protein [Iodobacter sp. CM08]
MDTLEVAEIKAFVPAKNYEVSKQFYQDIGFTMASDAGGVAYFYTGSSSFLLQNFYVEEHANHFMMHLLVKDVLAWHAHLSALDLVGKYQVKLTAVEVQPWKMQDFVLIDPSGVLWRIGQNI